MSKKYRTAKLEEALLARVQVLAEDVVLEGTRSLPEALRPLFSNGASQAAILDAALRLLEEEWAKGKKARDHGRTDGR